MTDATPAYTVTARTLHWVTASLVLFNLPLGLVIANNWGGPLQDQLYDLHRSIGALVIPIILVRVLYRFGHPPAPLPDDIPALQQLAATATHWTLYALLIVQPFLGWIGTSAYPARIVVFGLFELPPIWSEDRAFSDRVLFVHSLVGLSIACLLAAHIGAALHHHFVRRDGILSRMISG
ncbi:MAG TPA: cytochrome b [Xanthobacteraceae bacterium]|nr:cytochrome b [Xanthobacteraceae bacterium]